MWNRKLVVWVVYNCCLHAQCDVSQILTTYADCTQMWAHSTQKHIWTLTKLSHSLSGGGGSGGGFVLQIAACETNEGRIEVRPRLWWFNTFICSASSFGDNAISSLWAHVRLCLSIQIQEHMHALVFYVGLGQVYSTHDVLIDSSSHRAAHTHTHTHGFSTRNKYLHIAVRENKYNFDFCKW